MASKLQYMKGHGGIAMSEALPGALPVGQNSPQVCPYALYAEQLSGTAFTVPRFKNLRSWMYRIRPSVVHSRMVPAARQHILQAFDSMVIDPNQLRWDPLPANDESHTWVDGLKLKVGCGDPSSKSGLAVYDYVASKSMVHEAFYSADGDFLIIPQTGTLHITTECGKLDVEPCEVVVVPRGIKFSVAVDGVSRGYACEIFTGHFELPNLGPIGANGLADSRDFEFPVAWFEDYEGHFKLTAKFMNKLFDVPHNHSVFDVVAWHGNYCPFKYDLRRFNCINSVSFDHPDPSIYTVLTCPSEEPGVAVVDFVIFPPRWMVADHTFRPPWFHKNCMSEFMGMIHGTYDAKVGGADGKGFQAGGSSLHSCMTPHGPDAATFAKASSANLEPFYFSEGLAFMIESKYLFKVSEAAISSPTLQDDYLQCWQKMPKLFNGEMKPSIDWAKVKADTTP